MQKRMITRCRTAGVKMEILNLYWDRIEWEARFLAGRCGDSPDVQNFLKELDRVKPEARNHVLKVFLE